jgi:hypothetical protein
LNVESKTKYNEYVAKLDANATVTAKKHEKTSISATRRRAAGLFFSIYSRKTSTQENCVELEAMHSKTTREN